MIDAAGASDGGSGAPLTLSVLDQAPVPEGLTGGDALRNTLDLARLTDQLGYHRYWVAEHHGTPGLACTTPEVMIGLIAHETTRLRVGSGGVMLPHYSPLKVAETFSMLSGLFPGRIDLGIGRAAGTDQQTAFALQRDRRQRAPDDFREQLDELLLYIDGGPARARPLPRYVVLPGRPHNPEPWLLGSSPQSAIWAAELGLPYCFADFINPNGAGIVAHYRATFTTDGRLAQPLPRPRVAVAAWAICADTDAEAADLASSFIMMMTLLHRGQLIQVPPVQKAKQFIAQDVGGRDLVMHRRLIVGAPPAVRAGIESLAQEYGADEVMLVNIMFDHAARMRSYELIAQEFRLAPSTEPANRPTAAAIR
jgi:luciferase family oxidoreductase group 1